MITTMWLKRIKLKNWRAYTSAQINMPRPKPESRSNVVVIGANNGVGKTSLLEAITLCLFDREGFAHLERARIDPTSTQGYGDFMSRVFSKQADMASPKSSVSIVFEVDNKTELEISRVWHFDSNRNYREQKLCIMSDGEDIQIPTFADRDKVLTGYVAEHILPSSLSEFFLFDSGRVQNMAQHSMKTQVRDGIEGILGIPILRKLEKDLTDYAKKRYSDSRSGIGTDDDLEALKEKERKVLGSNKANKARLKTIEMELSKLEVKRDALLEKYATIGGDNMLTFGKTRERLAQLEKMKTELKEKIAVALVDELSLSLVGDKMLGHTCNRLISENARDDWEQDKDRGSQKYELFIDNLSKLNALDLPLDEGYKSELQNNLKMAWDKVWFPMPEECAQIVLNPHFSREDRNNAISTLNEAANYSVEIIRNKLAEVKKVEAENYELGKQFSRIRGDNSKEALRLKEEITEIDRKIKQLHKQEGDLSRQLQAIEDEVARVRQELGRRMKLRKDKGHFFHCYKKAEITSQTIQRIIAKSYPLCVSEIGKEMTRAYVTMAHKGNVSEILLDDDCEIKLLTAEGNNLREIDLSHGESQIFSLSLIAAIARVSSNKFPFIIDTPLANLDRLHRRDFLRYFSNDIDNQVIFLSTDEEIRKEQLTIIDRHVAHKFLIEQNQENGYGINVINPSRYFWETDL